VAYGAARVCDRPNQVKMCRDQKRHDMHESGPKYRYLNRILLRADIPRKHVLHMPFSSGTESNPAVSTLPYNITISGV
jgi:hypothetical protein